LLVVLPAVLLYRLSASIVTAEKVFPGFSQFFSLIPGLTGIYLRRAFYRHVLPRCGHDVCICFGTVFSHCTAELGDRVYIGVGCMIGDATLEDDVLVGSYVSIINGRRQHGIERLDIPVREHPGEYRRILVGRDSWIGDRSLVTASIGHQAVVGAASVVLSVVPDKSVVAGSPCKVIRFRDRKSTSDSIEVDEYSPPAAQSTETDLPNPLGSDGIWKPTAPA
jgi:acetyltransferase-like isoleucine patch superfamily enzyme